MKKEVTAQSVWEEFNKDCTFKDGLNLYETVRGNEDFYIGRQWEGVQANGLPTPVFNFIKRIILFLVASTATDNLKMAATPLSAAGSGDVSSLIDVVNAQFDALFEQNKLGKQSREFMRNSAVDGDACLYSWFDPDAETGQTAKGTIRTEILENTRVGFGDPNNRDVQSQPYILISRRELLSKAKEEAQRHEGQADDIISDSDETGDRFDAKTDGKVTTVVRFWKENGEVWAVKVANNAVIRPKWNTGMKLYPIVWMPWDYVPNCYHGQAAVTGLIPNQIFVNKMFALTMLSLMTTAYPKVIYNKQRISHWDSGVGRAIPVAPGDEGLNDVAKVMDPATISPQVAQFIELAISLTKEFMGATDAALGDTKPDNTSAILALQKASSVPMELTKQNFYQCIEDLGRIWLDQMRAYYGVRFVDAAESADGTVAPTVFDFGTLESVPLSIKLDVGGSAYWSEIAQLNTLDNLLTGGQITVVDYLERLPEGYISNKQELIETLESRMGMPPPGAVTPETGAEVVPDPGLAAGYQTLERKALEQTLM